MEWLLLNAEDYFLHANDTPGNITPKPRSNVNEFGVSVGGPIRKNKLFFFGHYEGVRIALPLVSQLVVPSPAYPAIRAQPAAVGGADPITGTTLPAEPARLRSTSRCSASIATLPERRSRSAPARSMQWRAAAGRADQRQPLHGSGCANQRQESLNNSDHENLIVSRSITPSMPTTASGTAFNRTPACRPHTPIPSIRIFNSYSPQPQRTLVAGYTHVFRPNLVNQFNPGASWYSSIFEPNNFSQVLQQFPIVLAGGQLNASLYHHRRQ